MRLLPLSRGLFSQVDDEDFNCLMQWKWRVTYYRGVPYAVRTLNGKYKNGKRLGSTLIFMARAVMQAKSGEMIDHKDRDTLNNQKANLRRAGMRGNRANAKLNRNSTTGFKGVKFDRGKWAANVGRRPAQYLGRFNDPLLAAAAYDRAALERYGEFACTNKSLGLL